MRSKEEAEHELAGYGPRLRKCITYGWDRWQELSSAVAHLHAPLKNRTRANFISDHIVAKVRQEFDGLPGVRVHEPRGFLELVIRNKYVIRFKKLDEKGRSRNILTRQQKLWFEGQLKLPHMPNDASRLIAGYVLDMLGTGIQQVLVTHPVGVSGVEWMIELPDNAEMKVVEMPRSLYAPKPPAVRSRKARPKGSNNDA